MHTVVRNNLSNVHACAVRRIAGALQVLANMCDAASVWLVGADRCGPLYVSALNAPPDGPEQRQFHSLLITLTKLSMIIRPTGQLIAAGAGLWQAAVSARGHIVSSLHFAVHACVMSLQFATYISA